MGSKARRDEFVREAVNAFTQMDRDGQDGFMFIVVRSHWQLVLRDDARISMEQLLELTASLSAKRRRELSQWLSGQLCKSDARPNVRGLDPDVWGMVFPELRG